MNHKTQPNCIARDLFAPWTIYIDSRPVESFDTESAAEDAYQRLLARPVLLPTWPAPAAQTTTSASA